ncbi:transketolase [Taibaiella koreensis]|uniref:transketolase n=1 Tax=Taibaiella koreensis TaxID=1268548 RepID=UPI000E59D060|nr:transketolase [Taibaiella koreensis]
MADDNIRYINLCTRALSIKKRFLLMYSRANAGHIGSSLSAAEILTFLFFEWMQDKDEFILSKGHAAAVLYSTLAEKEWLSEEDIDSFYQNDTFLAAHPPANKLPHIPFATGSLGHGLSLAAGIGMARRLKQSEDRVFCVTSDGELNEGSIWEAAMFIAHHQLRRVVWIIDKNNLQGFGSTQEVMNLDPLADKLRAFQFDCLEIDGHNFEAWREAMDYASTCTKPLAVIANTIKGRDWATYENKLDSHYLPFKELQYEETLQRLEHQHREQVAKYHN